MPTAMSYQEQTRVLQCPDCPRRFSRPSHLGRHQITHLTSAQKRLLPCQRCDKSFSRRDVLLRHLRSAHNLQGQQKRSAQRSCLRCVAKKLKCERTDPCSACLRSGAPCEYSVQTEIDGLLFEDPDELSRSIGEESDEAGLLHGLGHQHSGLPTPSDERSHIVPGCASRGVAMNASTGSGASSVASSMCLVDESPETTHHRQDTILTSQGGRSTAFPDMRISQPLNGMLPNMEHDTSMEALAISPTYSFLMQPNFHIGGFDWLSFDIDDGVIPGQSSALGDCAIPQNWTTNSVQQVPILQDNSLVQNESFAQPVIAQNRTARSSPTPGSQPVNQSSLPWPFDQTRESTPHRYRLPPLREVLGGIDSATEPLQPTMLGGFIEVLSDSYLPRLTQLRSSNAIQAYGNLQRLIDSYFARFHDIQAIIHKATWNMSECPTVLLNAMACVGALLSDSKADTELSCSLSEICATMISWMGASDGTNYLDISYLNALCLHQIYSLGSGNRQLYQSADRSRGVLIGGLRGMGLLRSRSSVDLADKPENITHSLDEQMLTREWKTWVTRELGRRAAWAAFEYDCSLCTLTSRRGIVDLSELPSILPCTESIWNAGSAQAWFALRSRLGANSLDPSLSATIKLTLTGGDIPPFLGSWAKRLCSQVLGRLLWDLKQLEVIAMPEHCGLASMLNGHRETKKSLLTGLNNLTDSLADPSSTSDLISYNISSLLCHYSHLYAASDVLDVVVYIVRNLISSGPDNHHGIEVARKRLRLAFASDPETARRLCWHAAQIVAIAKEYLVSAPCEIMRVFMGYIFILAYSAYGPRHSVVGNGQSVQLDSAGHQISQRRVIVSWIHAGGPASLGSVQDIGTEGCVPAISQDAQRMLQKLQCWGLAERFIRVFQLFEIRGF